MSGFSANTENLDLFPSVWWVVNGICINSFNILDKEINPSDFNYAYNEFVAALCKAHEHVYRLTTYQCSQCPTLVRGSNENNSRVTCDSPESTQVLVVYYLLRELLKKQVQRFKRQLQSHDGDELFVHNYVDLYEKFSTVVNLIKGCFTCLHWVWLKRGLPPEHIIFPTELLALQLWSEHVLDRDSKEKLQKEVEKISNDIRSGKTINISLMENVKRLSLNIFLISDDRQPLYIQIVEKTYLAAMCSWYINEKANFKKMGPEAYIKRCGVELIKEHKRATFLLDSTSYEKVKVELVQILLIQEEEYLTEPVVSWLHACYNSTGGYENCLRQLFGTLGEGGWHEKTFLHHFIVPMCAKKLSSVGDAGKFYEVLSEMRTKFIGVADMLEGENVLLSLVHRGILKALQSVLQNNFIPGLVTLLCSEMNRENSLSDDSDRWATEMYKLYMEIQELENRPDMAPALFSAHYKRELKLRLLNYTYLPPLDNKSTARFEKEVKVLDSIFIKGVNFDLIFACKSMIDDVYSRSAEFQKIVLPKITAHVKPKPVIISNLWCVNNLENPEEITEYSFLPLLNNIRDIYEKHFGGKTLTFAPSCSSVELLFKNKGGSPKKMIVTLPLAARLLKFNKTKNIPIADFTQGNPAIEKSISLLLDDGILVKPDSKHLHVGRTERQEDTIVLLQSGDMGGSIPFRNESNPYHDNLDLGMLYDSSIITITKNNRSIEFQKLREALEERIASFQLLFSVKEFKESLERLLSKAFINRFNDTIEFNP
ncbi:cullin 5 [Angomonas deanei]|uniref:Cullin family, putative n=1 Tax=Angomonas deanei TaxID=59799 RepID=A0A7G2CKR9_9TRYP|nr:cullin 5 [Angomonas deanei]CAD2218802.1 Cullin family, putative [Angomonas deanei]|eukprot:EPY23264.1 cullin 5 [Angomonas deanei]